MWLKFHYDELQHASKTKDEFLAMITHELKTPLVPIKGYVDLLLQEKFDAITESQKQRLQLIKNSTDSLYNMITQLLDTQKINLGQFTINKKQENLTELIHNIIMEFKPNTDKYGIVVISEIEKNVSCLCDKKRIKEVLSNLISNAIDFRAKDPRIQIILESKENEVKIVVKDNGVGISSENIDKLFTKFYQVDTTSTREHGGTGLGLSICKGIIEAHEGKIWVESKGSNNGTEIHIILPMLKK
jgi:signal transduction histidine kinase